MSYTRHSPFLARLKARQPLCKPGSQKNTHHLVLDIGDAGLSYTVGDSVGILPRHTPLLIERTLQALKARGDEVITLSDGSEVLFIEWLATKANLTTVSPKLIALVAQHQTHSEKKLFLKSVLEEESREQLKHQQSEHEVWDFLLAHPEVHLTPQEWIAGFMPLLPRFYSIASSNAHVGDEIHLTIIPLSYKRGKHIRHGVCTQYLCEHVPFNESLIPLFIQPAQHFGLPADPDASLIMIGPGTGVAPFRAFLQERILCQGAAGRHWLFFGEQQRNYDFFYEEEWESFAQKGHLRLTAAFSRDQADKIYVQHRLWEHREELYQWLEEGAYLYVCGDAQRMAKDVEAMLHTIVRCCGNKDEAEAREYIKQLRRQKRYLRDVY